MEAKQKVVAFLGPKASYTHQATTQQFPESDCTIICQSSIEDVFAAVQTGTASHGVVPFENSSNGSVVFTLDLFADLQGRYPDILVCGEIYLPVHHCLLGHVPSHPSPKVDQAASRSLMSDGDSPDVSGTVTPTQAAPRPELPRVQPSHDVKGIRKLYSHPQAWGQCKLFLSTYLKGVERQDVSSTSKAAEHVAQDKTGTSAAISSKIAAELNGLSVLAEGIEDNEGNSTRFFVLRRRQEAQKSEHVNEVDESTEMERYKSLVMFTVNHGEPGALARSLEVFNKFGLNLTSINTRPSGETQWHYIFFVEFLGRKRPEGKGGAVNDALNELDQVARSWRWLGSWESAFKE
ncbi:prephenate dehydratase [Vermiconidia calcicola]|uniref:Prephenate dehydratase n=1 Tax=Vermiconidia calcicola TaxID=1690605 RepID=A0ACC3NIR9_9PEZI|nr:prephenate dehydratase [Vermiconidia calcicola]